MSQLGRVGSITDQTILRPCREQELESQLLAGVRAGDKEASAALVRKYGGKMLAVARRFLSWDQDSADAVQDAFLAAFRCLDQFAGHSSLGTWLHRIVVNACLAKLRTQSRSRTVPIADLLPTFERSGHHAQPVQPWPEDALSQLTREETRIQVRACIDRLPEPYRTVLLLRDIEELDTEQTAQRLGINSGAVKTRLHRARQALRTLLAPLVLEEAPVRTMSLRNRAANRASPSRMGRGGAARGGQDSCPPPEHVTQPDEEARHPPHDPRSLVAHHDIS